MDCPVCKTEASVQDLGGGPKVICIRCGNFTLSDLASNLLSDLSPLQIASLSGWIRERSGCSIDYKQLQSLLNINSPSVGEKADRLLQFMAAVQPKPGGIFHLMDETNSADEVSLTMALRHIPDMKPVVISTALAVSWSQDKQELFYLIHDYLFKELSFLHTTGHRQFQITPRGWTHLYSLQHGKSTGHVGFIAMWFDSNMDSVHTVLEDAIDAAGYKPLRIDKHHHNNKIDDEILAAIRRSKFLVSDFTGERGGVYFESGFALGLGIPVIWLCRKDVLDKVHFDNRQYNFITWEPDKLSELKTSLQNRIEATIGRGSLTLSDITAKT